MQSSERGRLRAAATGSARERSRSRERDGAAAPARSDSGASRWSRGSDADQLMDVPVTHFDFNSSDDDDGNRDGFFGGGPGSAGGSQAGSRVHWAQPEETTGERLEREAALLSEYRRAGVVEELQERVARPAEDETGERRVPSQAEVRMYRMMRAEPFTEEDIRRQVQEDTEFLRWEPVPHESVQRTQRILGPVGAAPCVGSKLSGSVAEAQQAALTEFVQMYHDNMPFMEPAELAQELAQYFERKVRQPVNEAARRLGEPCLPEWTPAAIHSYFTTLMEPSVWQSRTLKELDAIKQELYTHGVFRRNVANPRERRVDPVALKQYLDITAQITRVYQLDSDKMFGANRLLATSEATPWLQPGIGKLRGQVGGGKSQLPGGNGEMAPPNRDGGGGISRQRSMVRAHSGRARRAAAAQAAAAQATMSAAVGAATTAAALVGRC